MLKQKTELYYGYKNKFVVAYNKIWLYSLKTLFRKYSNYRLKMHIVAQAEEIVHFQEHRKLKVWYEYKTKSDYFNLGALKEVYHSSFFTDGTLVLNR